jgi:hypothetical protein
MPCRVRFGTDGRLTGLALGALLFRHDLRVLGLSKPVEQSPEHAANLTFWPTGTALALRLCADRCENYPDAIARSRDSTLPWDKQQRDEDSPAVPEPTLLSIGTGSRPDTRDRRELRRASYRSAAYQNPNSTNQARRSSERSDVELIAAFFRPAHQPLVADGCRSSIGYRTIGSPDEARSNGG